MTVTRLQDASLREAVFENLYNALLGGYAEVLTMSTADVAVDLINYAGDMEIYEICELIPIIDQWEPRRTILGTLVPANS